MKDKEHLMKKATINALEVPEKTEEGEMIFERKQLRIFCNRYFKKIKSQSQNHYKSQQVKKINPHLGTQKETEEIKNRDKC